MAFIKITEQESSYHHLEKMSVREILEDINKEDQSVAPAVKQALPQIEQLVQLIVPRMKEGGRVFYLGAGTSGRLGVLDASELPPTFGVPSNMFVALIAGGDKALKNAVEGAEDDAEEGWKELQSLHVNTRDTVIGIAASGTTPYVVCALQEAKIHGIPTACITSNPGAPITKKVDISIEITVGPELLTGSSRMKSGTGQKMILNMISTTVMIQLGRVEDNKMTHMKLSNRKLVDRGSRIVAEDLGVDYGKAQRLLLQCGSVAKAIERGQKK